MKKNETLIIIPVFNEEKSILGVLASLKEKITNADLLIVNDGSSDNTREALKSSGVPVIEHIFNMGIGTSFQTGCKFAVNKGYKYIVRIDGDGQHDPSFIETVLKPVKEGDSDIAIGSRFLEDSEFKSSFPRLIGIKLISSFLYFLTGKKASDPTSGFCSMNRKAFAYFSAHCVEDYPEPDILLHHRDFRISEVPISVGKRERGVSSITPLKSFFYMYKVLFSISISIFRKE